MTTQTKKAPAKTRRKVVTPKATKAAAPAKEAKTNAHLDAGVNVSLYKGMSTFVNGNRKPQIATDVEADTSKMTDRRRAGLYALRDAYGEKTFRPRGFDNRILAVLIGAGLVSATGGTKETINGIEYLVDGDKPITLKLTTAGQTYGKA